MSEHEATIRSLANIKTNDALIEWASRDAVGMVDAFRWAVAELDRLQPPADLPATLASVDDVGRVCEAAGLSETRSAPGPNSHRWLIYPQATPDVRTSERDGRLQYVRVFAENRLTYRLLWTCQYEVDCPTALLWHAIQAARSAS